MKSKTIKENYFNGMYRWEGNKLVHTRYQWLIAEYMPKHNYIELTIWGHNYDHDAMIYRDIQDMLDDLYHIMLALEYGLLNNGLDSAMFYDITSKPDEYLEHSYCLILDENFEVIDSLPVAIALILGLKLI